MTCRGIAVALVPRSPSVCCEPSSVAVYCQSGRGGATLDDVREYDELGVHSLQVDIRTLDDLKRFADEVLPRVR
jgi:hypothetical protein